jgi:thiamine biosynthesis lipoprotein
MRERLDLRRTIRWPPVIVLLTLAAVACASADDQELKRHQYRQIHLGVQVRIVLYAADPEVADRACRAAFGRIAELEDIFSDYRPSSELMRLCARAGGPAVPVSEELFTVLAHAHILSQQTNGAFDATVGPYVRLWRHARDSGRRPSYEEWRCASELVGWRKVRLDPEARTVELLVPEMQLDLGGIAKGYILDRALETLQEKGVPRALIQAGGEIVASDPPPGQSGWKVKIAHARPGERYVRLENGAVSSSGDTEQFVVIDGRRYSHIVDPRVGLRFGEPIVVTVIGPDAMTADGLATAACVLGEKEGQELLRAYPAFTARFHRPAAPADQQHLDDTPGWPHP